MKLDQLKRFISSYRNFPKKGIVFRDILEILQEPTIFKQLIKEMSDDEFLLKSDAIISIDARGFIFGSALSDRLSLPNILIRKKGKLPPPVISQTYNLEYGQNEIQVSKSILPKNKNILIIDDLIASGGSAQASSELLELSGNNVVGICVGIKLSYLKPEQIFKKDILSVCDY